MNNLQNKDVSRRLFFKLAGFIRFQIPDKDIARQAHNATQNLDDVNDTRVTRRFKIGSSSLSDILMPYVIQEIEKAVHANAPLCLMETETIS